MAESNPTQVILTDDGIKIIKAQNTADNAASGVASLNDPNLMSVIEKQNSIGQFAGLTSQYNTIVQDARDDGIDTNAITTAYNNLNRFMADILADPNHASDIDRVRYKKYQDAYNGELAKTQNALQNSANNKFASAASATKQAASTASQAFSTADSAYKKAQEISNKADSSLAAQSEAIVEFSGKADSAAADALSAQNAASDAVKKASSAAVDSKDAQQIAGAVRQSYKKLTDGSTMTIAELQSGLAVKLTKKDLDGYATETWAQNQIKLTADGINGTISSVKGTVNSHETSINDLKADSSSFKSQFTTVNNTLGKHTTDIGSLQASSKELSSNFSSLSSGNKTNQHDISELQQTAETLSSTLATVKQGDEAIKSTVSQLSSDINLRVSTKDLIDQINLQAGKTLISSSGQLTLSGKTIYFDTDNPVIIPSANITGTLTGKKLMAADIYANTFKTNNETFKVEPNGAITAKDMTLVGGILTTPTINTGTINGATINGTTFHGGDVINDANNASKYYPMTITPDGSYKSTYFDSSVGLQSSVESGAIIYKYRSMIGSGQFIAYDSVINGQGLELQSGYTSTKDTNFSNQKKITGYVTVNANDGLTLHGDNQQITFNGTSGDVTPKGIIITPYGNINPNGTQNIWYVGNGPTMKTASFGIDGSGANNIQFNRSLDIGNFNINTYHTITSSDNGPIHFNGANGRSGDIYAGTVHYKSLAKASLLSVKKDVKKADTAYWAQLVNSIDLATYQYKTDDNTSHIRLSSIVDDVNDTKQWQLPDVFISRDENGKLCGVDDSVLLNATLATVQEQQKQIDQLNGHNMELEARLNKLEAKLNG